MEDIQFAFITVLVQRKIKVYGVNDGRKSQDRSRTMASPGLHGAWSCTPLYLGLRINQVTFWEYEYLNVDLSETVAVTWTLYQPQAGREVIHHLCSHCCRWDTRDSSIMQIVFLSFSYSSTLTIAISPNTKLRQEWFQYKAMCSRNNSQFTQSVDTRNWKYYNTSAGKFRTCTCINGQEKKFIIPQ
jgi:hypothetical protein